MFNFSFSRVTLSAICAGALLVPTSCQAVPPSNAIEKNVKMPDISSKFALQALPFALHDVRLLDSPFKDAMERDLKYLISLEPDRFLSGFRKNAGLEPKAPMYGGWESQGVAGFSLGHYLSACSMAYATTGDARFKERADYIVSELALCQSKNADGYVAAIPDGARVWKEVAAGDIRSQGFDLNGLWVPWYTMHKVFAGLIDCYDQIGNEQAKTVALKLADWADATTKNLSEEQWQRMLACEHGGMNESMAQIYAWTGDKKYLALSENFDHKAILDPLSHGDASILPGKHANTQIPKVIGAARQYELTGAAADKTIATTFWNAVVHDHTYVIGGNSSGEHFGPPDKLNDRLTDSTCETCNTYNMIKLSGHLFEWNPNAAYMDYVERALYNHILASQNPETGMMCYYVPLEQGDFKKYSSPFDSFWCCVGTGMENHVKYNADIYFHDANSLYVNLFIPSVLTWKDKGLTVKQETQFPNADTTKLTFSAQKPEQMTLKVRYPAWVEKGALQISVNGKNQSFDAQPSSYVGINRTWKSGDIVEIKLPMRLQEEAMPDNAKRVALLYGPIVLAGTLGSQDSAKPVVPVFVENTLPLNQWIKPIAGQPLNFKSTGAGRPQDVSFVPFYQAHDERYSVYFDLFTPAQWNEREAKYRADEEKRKKMEARTVDFFQPGEMQPERDHALQSEKSNAGEALGRKWRDASDGGWFAFDLKTDGEKPQDLVLTFWGGETGSRVFDILVDGKIIATQTLLNNQPNEFFDATYALTPQMTRGKDKITIRLQAHPGMMAGGLFGARLLRRP